MNQLSQLLDELEAYDMTDATGKLLQNTATFGKLRTMAEDMDRVLSTDGLPAQPPVKDFVMDRAVADPQLPTPGITQASFMLSVIYDVPGHSEPLVVGWNTCHRCLLHLSLCHCKEGPLEPPSVQQWRERAGHAPKKAVVEHKPKSVAAQLATIHDAEGNVAAYVETKELPHDRVSTPVGSSDVAVAAEGDTTAPDGPACNGCGIAVSTENADQNDDGTWTCFACQTQEA